MRYVLVLAMTVAVAVACARPRGESRLAAPANGWKPFSLAILEDYDKGEDLADIARDFAMFRELGISVWRGSLGWDDYEPERGRYDFEWLHRFLTLAAEREITVRPYLGYTPEWAAGGPEDRDDQAWNQPPKETAAWAAFTQALATEFQHHKNVRTVEIYNEQNVPQWWEGTLQEYAATLTAAAAAMRRAGPFDVLVGGLVFPDVEWVEQLCSGSAAAAFDELPVHAYPETWTPPDVTVENYLGTFSESFVAAADRACGRKRISINEAGFATVPGKSELDQAAWWVRAVATFAAEPRVEYVGVYEIKDLAAGREAIGDTPNYHLGLARADRTRKLAFSTVALLSRLMNTGSLAVSDGDVSVSRGKHANAGELHYRMFTRRDGDRVLFVWNRTADEVVAVRVNDAHGAVLEYALDGSETRVEQRTLATLTLRAGVPRIFRIPARAAP